MHIGGTRMLFILLVLKCVSFGASSRIAPKPACRHVCVDLQVHAHVCVHVNSWHACMCMCVSVHVHQVTCTWSAETLVRTRRVRVLATCLYSRWKCYLYEYNLWGRRNQDTVCYSSSTTSGITPTLATILRGTRTCMRAWGLWHLCMCVYECACMRGSYAL